ncbi:hypothetical protein [Acidiphilium iwatense]|uniref:Uncharacterized protein n=1 Tax=Acidiphilium iwatense TaxID=768198 RepID=A0ABS9DX75_9PROT|nr:hypothetical protein [Acidiphilium iwatense]MCF3947346.1 hypothetical protein [Acidiphilium iwatense]
MDEELAARLLAAVSQGRLMQWLADPELPQEEWDRAIKGLAELHGSRRINVFEHIRQPSGQDGWRIDFGQWSRIYQVLIPLLDDEIGRVVPAIAALSKGSLGPFAQEAFLGWCMRDRRRIDGILALEPIPETPDFSLIAAVVAGVRTDSAAYLDIAIAYVQGAYRMRTPGIQAIASVPVESEDAVKRAVSALKNVLGDGSVPIRDRVHALNIALELAKRCGEYLDEIVGSMTETAAVSGQPELLTACCNFITLAGNNVRSALLPHLLKALQSLDIEESGACSAADTALYSLLTHGRQDEALASLETLLQMSNVEDSLELLGSTAHYLSQGAANSKDDGKLLQTVICKWLLTGNERLCAGARSLLNLTGNQRFVFDFDPGNLNWSAKRTLYLARKAIGWLMPHGTAPASFLVCLLHHSNADAGRELGELLFDPLLINYPLATREYLEAVQPSLPDAAKSQMGTVLARETSYREGINEVGFVPELQPTERQRWIEHEKQAEAFAEGRKWAEGKSALRQLFKRQTLLFGTRAISYVSDFKGGTRRLDNTLGTMHYETDNLMGWAYDPFGLDYILRVFRREPRPE